MPDKLAANLKMDVNRRNLTKIMAAIEKRMSEIATTKGHPL